MPFFLDDTGNQLIAVLGKADRVSSPAKGITELEYKYENNFNATFHLSGDTIDDGLIQGIELSCPNFTHSAGVIPNLQPVTISGEHLQRLFGFEPILHKTLLGELMDLDSDYYQGAATICESVLGLTLYMNTGTEGLVTVSVGIQWMTSKDSISDDLSHLVGRCISLSDEGSYEVSNMVHEAFKRESELVGLAKNLPVTSIDVSSYYDENADANDAM